MRSKTPGSAAAPCEGTISISKSWLKKIEPARKEARGAGLMSRDTYGCYCDGEVAVQDSWSLFGGVGHYFVIWLPPLGLGCS